MGVSITQLLVILLVVLILFGAGKLPKVMGDLGKGAKNFRDALKDKQDVAIEDDRKEDKK